MFGARHPRQHPTASHTPSTPLPHGSHARIQHHMHLGCTGSLSYGRLPRPPQLGGRQQEARPTHWHEPTRFPQPQAQAHTVGARKSPSTNLHHTIYLSSWLRTCLTQLPLPDAAHIHHDTGRTARCHGWLLVGRTNVGQYGTGVGYQPRCCFASCFSGDPPPSLPRASSCPPPHPPQIKTPLITPVGVATCSLEVVEVVVTGLRSP